MRRPETKPCSPWACSRWHVLGVSSRPRSPPGGPGPWPCARQRFWKVQTTIDRQDPEVVAELTSTAAKVAGVADEEQKLGSEKEYVSGLQRQQQNETEAEETARGDRVQQTKEQRARRRQDRRPCRVETGAGVQRWGQRTEQEQVGCLGARRRRRLEVARVPFSRRELFSLAAHVPRTASFRGSCFRPRTSLTRVVMT